MQGKAVQTDIPAMTLLLPNKRSMPYLDSKLKYID